MQSRLLRSGTPRPCAWGLCCQTWSWKQPAVALPCTCRVHAGRWLACSLLGKALEHGTTAVSGAALPVQATPHSSQAHTLSDLPEIISQAVRLLCRSRFWLPAATQVWEWAFHSCNGLSMNADTKRWGAPTLWEDVPAPALSAAPARLCGRGGSDLQREPRVARPLAFSCGDWLLL